MSNEDPIVTELKRKNREAAMMAKATAEARAQEWEKTNRENKELLRAREDLDLWRDFVIATLGSTVAGSSSATSDYVSRVADGLLADYRHRRTKVFGE